jgi:hypothetical protein
MQSNKHARQVEVFQKMTTRANFACNPFTDRSCCCQFRPNGTAERECPEDDDEPGRAAPAPAAALAVCAQHHEV